MIRLLTILLLLLLYSGAHAGTYSDGFPQANENPLSSSGNWVAAGTNPRPQVVTNRVRVATVGDFATSIYNTAVTNDQFAQITVPTWNNSGAAVIIAGLLLRAADAPTVTYYEIDIIEDPGLTARYEIYRVVAGAYTALAGPIYFNLAAGDILRATIEGSTIHLYQNFKLLTAVTDASPITSGKVGFIVDVHTGGAIGDAEIDDFYGGDYPIVGCNLAMNVASSAFLLNAPTSYIRRNQATGCPAGTAVQQNLTLMGVGN